MIRKIIASHTSKNDDLIIIEHCKNGVLITISNGIGEVGAVEMTLDEYASFVIEQAEFMASYVPKDPCQEKLDLPQARLKLFATAP